MKRLSSLVLVTAALGLAGCAASGPKFAEVEASTPAIKADAGRVYFYRNDSMMGAALQPAREGAGEGAVAVGDLTVNDRGAVALRLLLQAAAAARQVVDRMRRSDAEMVEVDDVDVGLVARRQQAAVLEADRQCRLARLRRHHERSRELFAAHVSALNQCSF